jgi:hypothetical protein
MRQRFAIIAVLVAALGLAIVSDSSATAPGPRVQTTFFGVVTDNVLLDGQVDLKAQLARMRAVGTGSIRFPIYWSSAQPYQSWREVPAQARALFVSEDGRPTSFLQIDREILAFARHGLHMLPVILQAPPWARLQTTQLWSPPANPEDYGRFVGCIVRRYGTHGQFWAQHPKLADVAPRWWQIWNEPAGGDTPEGATIFWDGPKPYEPRYLAMLRATRTAARAADPEARIVLAGLFGDSWDALAQIYKYGGRGLFDAVAVHPYADTPAHVLTILRYVHRTMRRERNRRLPLLVTETGWPSSKGHATSGLLGIETTETRQASNLAAEYRMLVAHRLELNLQAIYWYTWVGTEPSSDPFDYSGLLRLTPAGRIEAKPAFRAYYRTLRHLET